MKKGSAIILSLWRMRGNCLISYIRPNINLAMYSNGKTKTKDKKSNKESPNPTVG